MSVKNTLNLLLKLFYNKSEYFSKLTGTLWGTGNYYYKDYIPPVYYSFSFLQQTL